jgi:hypothetical protein
MFDKSLWASGFSLSALPHYPCPSCAHGRLSLEDGSYTADETESSKAAHSHEAWDPDWIDSRFSLRMRCSNRSCGEIVTMIGNVRHEMFAGAEEWEWEEILAPKAAYPAPRMIELPQNIDAAVTECLERAAALFWIDYAAAAGCLRVSVERIMDLFNVPKTGIRASGKSGKLDLAERISAFETISPGNSQMLNALRVVGNLGVHAGEVSKEAILDVMMIYETVLAEIFDKRMESIREAAKKLVETKGRI